MQLHLLGTGTPILDERRPASSAFLVEIGTTKLLFDTGRGTTMQLLRQGISPTALDAIFITHHHYDHICDLGEVLMAAWHNGRTQPLPVYGPRGTRAIIDGLFHQVFARDIAFTLHLDPTSTDIRDLVQVMEVDDGWRHDTSQTGAVAWSVQAALVNHGNTLGLSTDVWPCLGYRVEADGKALVIGGDTVDCPGLAQLATNADALLLSCYLTEIEVTSLGAETLASHVIATAHMAGRIATQYNVHQLILTHFRKKSPDLMTELVDEVRSAYGGPLVIGEDLMVVPV